MKSRETTHTDILVGRRIHEIRIQKKISMQEVGAAIGVTHQQIRKYEVGENRISTGRLYEIARFLGVTDINTFFTEE